MKSRRSTIDWIWMILLAVGVGYGAIHGTLREVSNAAMEYAGKAVTVCIGFLGTMCLWMGIMKVAEQSGMLQKLASLLRPVMVRLFPEVPPEHPAMGAMIMNLSANMMGLGNAATPLGLRAMEALHQLNHKENRASNAMVLFLAINTSSVTLIPTTVIALRAAAGSQNPGEILLPALITTTISTITAISLCKLFEHASAFAAKRG